MTNQRTMQTNPAVSHEYYVQTYGGGKTTIDGVKQLPLKTWLTEDGDFGEILRLTEQGEMADFPGFKPRQINRSQLLPNTVKAWHFHFNQDEVWYVPAGTQLLVGLWDIRANSSTKDQTQRIVLGGAAPSLLYIPKGVAHGAANFSGQPVALFYFVSQQFNPDQPDENRVPWNALPDFWQPERD